MRFEDMFKIIKDFKYDTEKIFVSFNWITNKNLRIDTDYVIWMKKRFTLEISIMILVGIILLLIGFLLYYSQHEVLYGSFLTGMFTWLGFIFLLIITPIFVLVRRSELKKKIKP